IFQPHRYTRTKALFNEFLTAFGDVDLLIVTDIYAASEEPIPGVTSEILCEAIRRAGHADAVHISSFDAIVKHLLQIAQPTDVVLTQGAGSVWKVGELFLKAAREGKENDWG
ncbi:MAG: UDP-N-acetylmuramate--L-alanine ligase, partial [Deltaproteobacteria bacterium]|nr:UDP-N-acetylmuramate--L-alanine ligase [Deltaproteobacteria bacterium]